jgi:hypothetical protein
VLERERDNVKQEMDQSDDEFFSPIYMLKKTVLVLINIEHNAMAATKKDREGEKKRQRNGENEWHAINIEDQQYFEQSLC